MIRLYSFAGALITVCVLISVPVQQVAAHAVVTVPSSAITTVQAIGVLSNSAFIYVASSTGLYRSARPPYSSWTKQSSVAGISSLMPDPWHPDTLIYAADGKLYYSTNAGRTAMIVDQCPAEQFATSPSISLARSVNTPSVMYEAFMSGESCPSGTSGIKRSMDGGRTWQTRYAYTPGYDRIDEGFNLIAVDPTNPQEITVGQIGDHEYGSENTSLDGGHTWDVPIDIPNTPLEGAYPDALGINPHDSSAIWIDWLGYLERNGEQISAGLPQTSGAPVYFGTQTGPPPVLTPAVREITFDPLTARVYIITEGAYAAKPARIYAFDPTGRFERFSVTIVDDGPVLTITRNGYLLSGSLKTGLTVSRLIYSNAWPTAPAFVRYYDAHGLAHILGRPISPVTLCGKYPCQYFEKGCLEDHGIHKANTAHRIVYGAIVRDLIAARSASSVGGSSSTVTYGDLYPRIAPSQRITPPPHFQKGVMSVPGGTFIPYSSQLSRAPGYIVPPYFWHYMVQKSHMPDGWLRDLGLPLTAATTVIVTKGHLGKRPIVLQAFQRGILTYDPRNALPFQVERANIGLDYATAFPQRAR